MAHCRIINSYWNPNDGISIVEKSSPYGIKRGVAVLHQEDEDVASQITGGTFAELQCDIEIEKERSKELAARARGMKHLRNMLTNEKYSSPCEAKILDVIDRQIEVAEREAGISRVWAHNMKKQYNNYVEQFLDRKRELRKKIEDKK